MNLAIVITTCVALILVVLLKPTVTIKGKKFSIYWAIPTLGALLLLCLNLVPFGEVISQFSANTSVNPIKILILFLSMTYISIYLDEVGFFKYLANISLKKAKTSQKRLFIYLYLTVSLLTVFTSNDIIILTFTPFICYFAKNADIDPVPYLVAEFVAANTWSMALIIGNPTNIYLATAGDIAFMDYVSVMILPTVAAGLTSFFLLFLIFNKALSKKISNSKEKQSEARIKNKTALIIGLTHLGLCTLLLILSSYVGFEMWLIACGFALSLLIFSTLLNIFSKKDNVWVGLQRMPIELIPFVLSMFILVIAISDLTPIIAKLFGNEGVIFKYGFSSFITANLINNIPMSVLYNSILANEVSTTAIYATVIGSNICAFFTPIGALAGIMWNSILKDQGINFSFMRYVKYGIMIALPTITAALIVLSFVST